METISQKQANHQQSKIMDASKFGKGGWFSHRGNLFKELEKYHSFIDSKDFKENDIDNIFNQFQLLCTLQDECEKYLSVPRIKYREKGKELEIQIQNNIKDITESIETKIDNFNNFDIENPDKFIEQFKLLGDLKKNFEKYLNIDKISNKKEVVIIKNMIENNANNIVNSIEQKIGTFDENEIKDILNKFEPLGNLRKKCSEYCRDSDIVYKEEVQKLKKNTEVLLFELIGVTVEKIDELSKEKTDEELVDIKTLVDIKALIEKNRLIFGNILAYSKPEYDTEGIYRKSTKYDKLNGYNDLYKYILLKIEYMENVVIAKGVRSEQKFEKKQIRVDTKQKNEFEKKVDKFEEKVTEHLINNKGGNINELNEIFKLEKECKEFLNSDLNKDLQKRIENCIIDLNIRKKQIIPNLKKEQSKNNNSDYHMDSDDTSKLLADRSKKDVDLLKDFNDLLESGKIKIELEEIKSIEEILARYNKSKNDSNIKNTYTNQVIMYSCLIELQRLLSENNITEFDRIIKEEKDIISNNSENSEIYDYAARSYEIEKYVKEHKEVTEEELKKNKKFQSFYATYEESDFEEIHRSANYFLVGKDFTEKHMKLNLLLGKLREEEIMGKLNDNHQDKLLKDIIQEIDNYRGECIYGVTGKGPVGTKKDNRFFVQSRMFNPFKIDRKGNVERLERDTIHELTHPTVNHKFNSNAVAFPIHILESEKDMELLKKVIKIRTSIIQRIVEFIEKNECKEFDNYKDSVSYAKRSENSVDKGVKFVQMINTFDEEKISNQTNIEVLCDAKLRKAYALLLADSCAHRLEKWTYKERENLTESEKTKKVERIKEDERKLFSSVLSEYDSVINELYLCGQINGYYNDEKNKNKPINKFFRAIKIVAQDAYDYRDAYKKSETEDGQRILDEKFKKYVEDLDEKKVLNDIDSIFQYDE